jgi:hypothetical protein
MRLSNILLAMGMIHDAGAARTKPNSKARTRNKSRTENRGPDGGRTAAAGKRWSRRESSLGRAKFFCTKEEEGEREMGNKRKHKDDS